LWADGKILDLTAAVTGTPSLQLVATDNINDRGEISGRGLPPGCDDLLACGQVYLLIPCNNASAWEGNTGPNTRRNVPVMRAARVANLHTPMERLAEWHTRLSGRTHILGLPTRILR